MVVMEASGMMVSSTLFYDVSKSTVALTTCGPMIVLEDNLFMLLSGISEVYVSPEPVLQQSVL